VVGIVMALASAALFGATTVALRFAVRENTDPELGAFVTAASALGVALLALAVLPGDRTFARSDDLALFAAAGLLAPGASQLLLTRAVRLAGASRTSIVLGGAPLVAVAIALTALDEPLRAPLVVGAALIVAGGFALVGERGRPDHLRLAGLVLAFGATVLFATRDNVVRAYADDAEIGAAAGAVVALGSGTLLTLLVVAFARLRRRPARRGPVRGFFAAGILFGLSYVFVFEAFFRAPVSVVSPLVATETLWGVCLSALLLRRSELVGKRLAFGAVLIVARSALIGAAR
jgi:drug/metabolite transporter (DMT)-like permease